MKDFRFTLADYRFLAAAVLLAMAMSLSAFAQGQPPVVTPTPTPSAATDEFLPMSQAAPREVLPATPLVFYAYGFVWVALMGYVFFMWRKMARVEQELAAVQRRLQDGAGGR